MKKFWITLFIASLLITQYIFTEDFDPYYKKLEVIDTNTTFNDTDITFLVTLVSEKPHEPKKALQYRLFRRDKDDLATLVQLAPEAEKGNGILMSGDNVWVYDPISRTFTHSSIKAELSTSDARASDISKQETLRNRISITDVKESTLGKFPVYVITATVISKDSDYAKEIYYIRKDQSIWLKIESYGASGRLMRTVLFLKYAKINNHIHPTQMIIRDEINKGEQTTQIFSDFITDKIPAKVFTKAYLEEIN